MAKNASASVPELATFNAAKKKADDLAKQLKDAADALREKGSSAATAKDFKALADAIGKLKQLRQTVPSAAQTLRDATDAVRTALDAYIASLAAKPKNDTQTAPDALSPLPPGVFPDTIAGSGMKVVNADPGGTTGAQIVEIDGRRYVFKTAGKVSAEHVRNEAAADQAYRRAGIRVPDCRIYEEDGKTYKLSEFIDGGQSLGDYLAKATPAQRKAVIEELRQGYVVDSLFANWDVLGTDQDNVLIDKDGHAWRIDNGSSFAFRARGSRKKPEEWEKREWPDEWRTLRSSSINKGVFDGLTAHDIFSSKVDLDAAVRDLPDETRKALAKPLEELKQMQARCANFDVGGYTPTYTSEVLEISYDMTKGGVREALPKSQINAVFAGHASHVNGADWLRPPKGAKDTAVVSGPTTDAAKTILDAAKTINYHLEKKDGKTNKGTVQMALDLKKQLEAAAAWDKNAPTLLGYLKEIESSKAHGFSKKISVVDGTLAVDFTDPAKKKDAQASTPQYSCFADAVGKIASAQGIDVSRAVSLFNSQGGSSANMGSCKAKVLELIAMGIDPSKPPQEVYMRSSVEAADKYYKRNPSEMEADRRALAAWKAATQLVLENCDIPRADKTSRTVRLLRTMDSGILKYKPQQGVVIPFIPEGAHESYAADWVVTWSGHYLTARDVPFSRITSTSYCKTAANADLYLGDDENEFGANVIGLPCVYLGSNHSKGDPAAPLDALIEAAEKKSGRRMRDFKAP